MRGVMLVCGTVSFLLAAASPGRADEKAELDALIDRAIKAIGGAEELKKHRAAKWEEKLILRYHEAKEEWQKNFAVGTYWWVQWPDRACMAIEGGAVLVMDREQAWGGLVTSPKDLPKGEQAEVVESLYQRWIATQLPLTDKMFELRNAGHFKVDGRRAVAVRVSSKGRRDLTLFFDQESALLIKLERRYKDQMTEKEVQEEWYFCDHQEFSGVKVPKTCTMKVKGEYTIECRMTKYEPLEKLDDELFDKNAFIKSINKP